MAGRSLDSQVAVAQPKLPAIPIPLFTGKVWEFHNFWTLFEANVHNQPLSRLQKFNYLVSALRGEARETVRRFTVTEANYEHAIDLLRSKYGDRSKLVDNLQKRLEITRADNQSIQGQRRLLEQIIPIIAQLEEAGISLNGSFLGQKVLSKFTTSLQRKVLERRLNLSTEDDTWVMQDMLKNLDSIITTEERINSLVEKKLPY